MKEEIAVKRTFILVFVVMLSIVAATQKVVAIECAEFVRKESSFWIFSHAYGWKDAAKKFGYSIGNKPVLKSVLYFPRQLNAPDAHVVIVTKVIDSRKITIDHANWKRQGEIERDVVVEDISEKGNWSQVTLKGKTLNTGGFILPKRAKTP